MALGEAAQPAHEADNAIESLFEGYLLLQRFRCSAAPLRNPRPAYARAARRHLRKTKWRGESMTSQTHRQDTVGYRNPLVEALIGYGMFCALGLISRFIPVALFSLLRMASCSLSYGLGLHTTGMPWVSQGAIFRLP